MTITEALAEIKTIDKRIASKREFMQQYLFRLDNVKDPLEKDGGSEKVIASEMQAVNDLEERVVTLRHNIQEANEETMVTIEGVTRSISDWLVWRREVAPIRQNFLTQMRRTVNSARDTLRRENRQLVPNGQEKPSDVIININEKELATQSEKLNNILGQLDGQLSLKNATVMIK